MINRERFPNITYFLSYAPISEFALAYPVYAPDPGGCPIALVIERTRLTAELSRDAFGSAFGFQAQTKRTGILEPIRF